MAKQLIIADKIFDGDKLHHNAGLLINNDRIESIINVDAIKKLGASVSQKTVSGLLAPGFVDTQVNGGGGILFNHQTSTDDLNTLCKTHLKFGTTAMLPTIITDHFDVMKQAADTLALAINKQDSNIVGIHFEGPALSMSKKGTHCQHRIRALTEQELALFARQDLGQVVVTLAPEVVPKEQIEWLTERNVVVSLGHTNASYETAKHAFECGANGVTHLFNAMSPLNARAPGVVGAALLDDCAYCGIIVDGHHVHPASLNLAIKAIGKDRIMLVTDAMALAGSDKTEVDFFDRKIFRQGNKLTSSTGELAGSTLTMDVAVKNAIQTLAIEPSDALVMAAGTPARFLGLDNDYGKLLPGYFANVVTLNNNYDVTDVWLKGQLVY